MEVLLVVGSFIMCAAGAWFMSRFAFRLGLIDRPNERSSHSSSTPRGGGIGILLAFLIAGLFFTKSFFFTILAGIIGLIGLLEDRFTIPPKTRLLLQIIISTVAVFLFTGFPTTAIAVILIFFNVAFITGTANFYNFMDGINGIAGLTGLVGFGLISISPFVIAGESDIALMSLVLSAGCLGFLLFNIPKAKVFMGDVGSIFLGFVFASFVVKLSANIEIFICLIMFLCTFYADALLTIFYRLKRRENLMQAHRSHLYQYMSNELQIPHWIVSLIYALTQFIFGLFALYAYKWGVTWQFVICGVFVVLFLVIYHIVKEINPRLAR
jgi:Fuc2NAc and GlcNAc transferase